MLTLRQLTQGYGKINARLGGFKERAAIRCLMEDGQVEGAQGLRDISAAKVLNAFGFKELDFSANLDRLRELIPPRVIKLVLDGDSYGLPEAYGLKKDGWPEYCKVFLRPDGMSYVFLIDNGNANVTGRGHVAWTYVGKVGESYEKRMGNHDSRTRELISGLAKYESAHEIYDRRVLARRLIGGRG